MRRALLFAFSLAMAAMPAPPASAAEPSMSVKGNSVTGIAAAQAQALATQAKSFAAGASAGTGPSLYLAPGQSAASIPGYGNLSPADQNLAQAGTSVLGALQALGQPGNGAVLQRRDNMYYVGVDGEGGRWFASAGEAISFMFSSQVAKSQNFSTETRQAAVYSCAADILCAVLLLINDPYFTIATVARGNSASVTINGSGFSNSGDGPVVAASDGIVAENVTFVSSEQLSATLTVLPNAKLGDNFVGVFNAGQTYRNAGMYKLKVIEGKGEAPVTQATAKTAAPILKLPGSASGKIVTAGAEQFFRIDVSKAGTLTLTSTGGVDLKGTLEDADGKSLVSNDDGAAGYNFKLARVVTPGTYFLRVGHCCTGSGAYQINATLAP